jgi:hypothetical protein
MNLEANTLAKVRQTDGLKPYKIDEVDAATTYMLYSDDKTGTVLQKVVKISVVGTVTTFESSIGLWANRASLTYRPING